ncbi:unnamed protein product [[Candida] boidinii]|nr:unnamed protein product [[Candida] boidinii]
MDNIKTAGVVSKAYKFKTLERMVSETREPAKTAPKNSQMAAKIIACQYFKLLEEMEEEKELAQSLAPMLNASKNAKIIAIAKT